MNYILHGIQKVVKKISLAKGHPFHSPFLTLPLQLVIINYLGFLESERLNLSVERGLLSGLGLHLETGLKKR